MADKRRRSPDAEIKSLTRFNEPQRVRLYVFERYAIIHKVMLSVSDSFIPFAVRHRRFIFSGKKFYYYRMSLVITKDEFLTLKRTLLLMDPLTGLSGLWFNLEYPNKSEESLKGLE